MGLTLMLYKSIIIVCSHLQIFFILLYLYIHKHTLYYKYTLTHSVYILWCN